MTYDEKVRWLRRYQDSLRRERELGEEVEQLHRLVTEERPGACVGCGFEHNCRRDGCAVLRKISRIVAAMGKRGTTS